MYEKYINKLKEDFNGLNLHSLHFVGSEWFVHTPEKLLQLLSIPSDSLVVWDANGTNYGPNHGGSAQSNIRGVTLSINIESLIEQVIIIFDPPRVENEFTNESYNHWKSVTNLCSLAHELGHVEDIQREHNSNFSITPKPNVNILAAEIYANAYCLNYLSSIGAKYPRHVLAKGIYNSSLEGGKFQKQLYSGVCNKLGKGRVKKWCKYK